MSQYVHELLIAWAHWKRRMDDSGLGFPNKVCWAEERVSRSVETFIPTTDPEILRMDRCIKKLPNNHRQVILWHYCDKQPVKIKAQRLGMKRARWYEHLDHAQAFLEVLLAERIEV